LEKKTVRTLTEDDLVFSTFRGNPPKIEPLLPDTVSHAWSKLIQKTGLKHVVLHGARHSHATILLEQGVHPKVVQERLAHAKIETNLNFYSHLTLSLQQAAAALFDKCANREPDKEVV